MLEINDLIYEGVAGALAEALEGRDYFSGSVEFDTEEVGTTLIATLLVYRRDERYPEGRRREITDIVPVWWEFRTIQECGEVSNDFSFGELKKYLLR